MSRARSRQRAEHSPRIAPIDCGSHGIAASIVAATASPAWAAKSLSPLPRLLVEGSEARVSHARQHMGNIAGSGPALSQYDEQEHEADAFLLTYFPFVLGRLPNKRVTTQAAANDPCRIRQSVRHSGAGFGNRSSQPRAESAISMPHPAITPDARSTHRRRARMHRRTDASTDAHMQVGGRVGRWVGGQARAHFLSTLSSCFCPSPTGREISIRATRL